MAVKAEYPVQLSTVTRVVAGIPEYWVVNLDEGCIEVYHEPAPMGEGYVYRSRRLYTKGEQIAPLQKPESTVKVEELLLSLSAP